MNQRIHQDNDEGISAGDRSATEDVLSIAIGSDDAAIELKQVLVEYLKALGHDISVYGAHPGEHPLYPDIATTVAERVASGLHKRGIILCGTGIGVSIAANKVPGIRAAVCHDPYSAQRSRMSNDCQIMTMGSRVVGVELAKLLVLTWLESEFQGGASAEKVDRLNELDGTYRRIPASASRI